MVAYFGKVEHQMSPNVWSQWIVLSDDNNTSATTSGDLWTYWSNTASSTFTFSDPQIFEGAWSNWVQQHSNWRVLRRASAEDAVRDMARVARERRARAHQEHISEPNVRARRLLSRFLDQTQKVQMRRKNCFHVIGSDGRRYEVDTTKRQHNVYELDEHGNRVVEHCIYLPGVPLGDNLLGQKLLLEADAAEFRRIANQTTLNNVGAPRRGVAV